MKTLKEAQEQFDFVKKKYSIKRPLSPSLTGGLVFAGDYWPKTTNPIQSGIKPIINHDVTTALNEARKITKAYIACCAATRGTNEEAVKKMEKWFGDRHAYGTDWWMGVRWILGAIETFILKNVNVYYRGDRSLIGKRNDYPGMNSDLLEEYDVIGYAETSAGDENNIIGLCEDFFAKTNKGTQKVALTGRDSVGGILIHELSHNLCKTEDHDKDGNSIYGETACESFAKSNPELAWYNADNLEYFFEDVVYSL